MPGLSDRQVKQLIDFAFAAGSSATRWSVTRHQMYSALDGVLAAEDGADKLALSISRSTSLVRMLGLREAAVRELAYPEHDLAALTLPDGSADFLVSDQVLEHCAGGPIACLEESRRVVRPGGFIVHTTCLINEVHQAPHDFWRLTQHAFAMLADRFGLELVTVGGWGNRAASTLVHMGYRKAVVPDEPENPVRAMIEENDPRHPIVTWMVARRPSAADEARERYYPGILPEVHGSEGPAAD